MVKTAQPRWTEAELRVCVLAYRELLADQAIMRRSNKADLRKRSLDELPLRDKGASEFRMQNISAVLDELGMEIVDGYLPRRNIGRAKAILIDLINDLWERKDLFEAATDDPTSLGTRVASAARKVGKLLVPRGTRTPARREASTMRFIRDPNVIAWVLAESAGRCEVCNEDAPFKTPEGLPYLEVHHVRPMADGGPDTIDNAAATCPNCHRRLHLGADATRLRSALIRKVRRLVDHPKAAV